MHKLTDIYNKIRHLLFDCIHKLLKHFIKLEVSRTGQFPNHVGERQFSDKQEDIKMLLLNDGLVGGGGGDGLFIGRFGSIELNAFIHYLHIIRPHNLDTLTRYSLFGYIFDRCYPIWWPLGVKRGMRNNAGFFPATDRNLSQWGELMLSDIKELDVLLSWQEMEKYITPLLSLKATILNAYIYNFYMYDNPWTEILKDKRILVVSPFSDSILSQYKRREHLFKNMKVLPRFELDTIQSFNVLRGNYHDSGVSNWFDALRSMEDRISQRDFDIALLGCGAYAFHLGAFIKRLGKKAVTLCGGLQCLFGIYGQRYEKGLIENHILNEYWVRPSEAERPYGYKKVENGAYW